MKMNRMKDTVVKKQGQKDREEEMLLLKFA